MIGDRISKGGTGMIWLKAGAVASMSAATTIANLFILFKFIMNYQLRTFMKS